MAFAVSIARPVVDYIRGRERLTVADQDRILAGLVEELRDNADKFLKRNPFPDRPDRFWYDYVLMTEAHEVREFWFVCSAEGHVYGVTEVLYAEERPTDAE